MSKFNRSGATPKLSQPVTTTGTAVTHEGGAAWTRDDKSQLVLTAVVNMVGEDTFYEKAGERDDRYSRLCRSVAVQDPQWMLGFITWLRGEANMRSASLVAAAEAVHARLDHFRALSVIPGPDGWEADGFNRKIVSAPLLRADEPGEFLAYWTSKYGRSIPKPVKRGLADAVRRLYTERSLLKYDTSGAFRFADVIDLVHPAPDPDKVLWQGDLFVYALDRRHGRDNPVPAPLETVRARADLMALSVGERRRLVREPNAAEVLRKAGMTWEALAGWLQGPMSAEAWEAVIPSMGYMALIRNLRNFDEAGVSDEAAEQVAARIADPAEVARSRQFPYRFLSAYRAAPSLRWGRVLDKALTAAIANIPAMPGRTLVLVDTSGSMLAPVSQKSQVRHVDVGALFGVALAARGAGVDLVGFADGSFVHPLSRGGSVLKQAEAFIGRVGEVGYGTQTTMALRKHYRPEHDRVVVVTDGQAFKSWGYGGGSVSGSVPAHVPLFGVDTTGYDRSSIDTSEPNRYEIGGFSDKLFTMVDLLSRGRDAGWPWEARV